VSRFFGTVESPTAVPTSAPSGSTPGMLVANILGNSSLGGRSQVRRLTIGIRAGTGAPTSQQVTLALIRTTARGTATATNAWASLEGYAPGGTPVTPANSPGVDVAWSSPPTPLGGSWVAPWFFETSFNTQAAVDLPYELLEEVMIQPGSSSSTYNGVALVNVGNALPTAHLYTVTAEVEF
jgi:hypothetical protein